MMHDTFATCYGCPFRREGCHGKCEGYQARFTEAQERNQQRRDSLAWISDTERERRVNVISSAKSNKKRR